jgi:Gpi18-like mannosyltransferase
LPAIVADVGSAAIVWALARHTLPGREGWVVMVCALSPVLIMVSGFHGNTDPVFGMFVLASLYLLLVRQNWIGSAVALALSKTSRSSR